MINLSSPSLTDAAARADLSEETRRVVAQVQQMVDVTRSRLASEHLSPSSRQLDDQSGFNPKLVLEAPGADDGSVRYFLHKPMAVVDAARTQFVTVLANLLGIRTPVAVVHEYRIDRALGIGSVGTGQIFLQGYTTPAKLDFLKLHPEAVLYLFMSRWFNDVVGNLHCWWGQLLIRSEPDGRMEDLVMIDFDDAFGSVDPAFLRAALETHFGKQDIRLRDCQWLARPFGFRTPVEWAPATLDSPYTIYGPLLHAYVSGSLDVDTHELCRRVMRTAELSPSIIEQAMQPFLEASTQHLRNPWVILAAAPNPRFHVDDFRSEFLARLERSRHQFCAFIARLTAARGAPHHPVVSFYACAPDRPY